MCPSFFIGCFFRDIVWSEIFVVVGYFGLSLHLKDIVPCLLVMGFSVFFSSSSSRASTFNKILDPPHSQGMDSVHVLQRDIVSRT